LYFANGIIAGGAIHASDNRTFDRHDFVSGAVVTRACAMSVSDAEAAADDAARAFPKWSSRPAHERATILSACADQLESCITDLVSIAAKEVGAAESWVRFNIDVAQNTLNHAASLASAIGEVSLTPLEGVLEGAPRHRLFRRPAGVVLGIAPWNAAITLAVRAVAAPLALGNTVVLKGSELCPKTHETIVQALLEAGLPDGVLNFVLNAPDDAHDVVEALIAHPSVRRVNFTGSTRVGREVAILAAQYLKPCLLELSGKASSIVLADADLTGAAKTLTHGAFFNQGQVCMSTDRIIVEEAVADELVALLKCEAELLRSDSKAGIEPLGKIIGIEAVQRLRGLVDDALAKGAVLVTGGQIDGIIIQPTILDHVGFGMRLYAEEIFGPLVGIVRVADQHEAVTIANDTEFGLAAAVFGQNLDRANLVASKIEAGAVHVNGSTVFDDPDMPYGGVKSSGYGRFGGQAVIDEFTEMQWITEREYPVKEHTSH
jgi:vanillin dehydrogenase